MQNVQNARCVQHAVFAQNVMFLQPQQLLPFCFSAGSGRSGSSWDHHRYQHHQSDRPLIAAILVALGFCGGASGPVLDAAQLFRETAAVIKSAFKQIIESK